ncbi:hypothetical protein PMIN06_007982 [Paraphaeosphaeria minitans]|uniref:DNA recombination and repair protein Rad51-like C-terminal domain-containing protein n=1 Tax=Paraphaeosphaeria minitans TaxID=565426 RepID=A0A9P6GWP2_9PLEO|nr:hypothetical protein PMIN01_01444 [Paraphaeosphaeria minitans]
MADVGAERLGARLMDEVEECGLGELLASLRTLVVPGEQSIVFNIPELDALLSPPPPAPIQIPHHRSDDDTWNPVHEPRTDPPPMAKKSTTSIIELVSPPHAYHPSPAGKTALIHLLTTHAILPSTLSNIPLHGLTSSIILLDPLHHFSTSFLATTLFSHITACFTAAGHDATTPAAKQEIIACAKHAMRHVHVLRPSSWDSMLATLRSLESHLFDRRRHDSMDRRVHALVVDDVDAFLAYLRTAPGPDALSAASVQLTRLLVALASTFSCAVVMAGRSATAAGFRPGVPLGWPAHVRFTRLAVRRVEVVPFAPGMSVEEAEAERGQRGEVVSRGRVEVWRVGGGAEKDGVVMKIGRGAVVEREEG